MKKILSAVVTAAVFIAAPAHAGVFATAPNQNNGLIVLSDVQGQCRAGWLGMFTTDAGGQVGAIGCWQARNNDSTFIHVWYAGESSERMYRLDGFRLSDEAERALSSK